MQRTRLLSLNSLFLMLYFKHSDLAQSYNISLRTVHNWVEATREGKLDLTLHSEGSKQYVANTTRNIALITQLVEEGRKYRNTRAVKVITPQKKFYETYSKKHIFDIVTQLEMYHEVPRQYNYFTKLGAQYWDNFAKRLAAEQSPNTMNSTELLLGLNASYMDHVLSNFKRVNVIDIGVGNAYPIRSTLAHLLENKKLGRYIALDISPDILKLAKTNINKWFGDEVGFEGYQYDVNYERFSDLLIPEYLLENAKETVNLVTLFGGTISNLRSSDAALKVIHDSLGANDLLMYATKLDTNTTRRYFDFNMEPGRSCLPEVHSIVPEMLNIDESFYEVEVGYDSSLQQRVEQLKLKLALVIRFEFESGVRDVELNKGTRLLTWRAHQKTAAEVQDQFDRNDFYLLHSSQTDDREYILTVSKVKQD